VTEREEKGLVMSVASWLWGTVKGGFNEQQSIAQIIVDAAISLIPVVGDATAIRDLVAVSCGSPSIPKNERRRASGSSWACSFSRSSPSQGAPSRASADF
jgi:hypothetical protein